MNEFNVDLHVHTCLSPCAGLEMVPTAIVRQAKMKHLDIVGICDHNSSENIDAVKKAGERIGIHVLGGIEITSSEEVHIMVFFKEASRLIEMQKIIYKNLSGENDKKLFGMQVIVDENDNPTGVNDRMLIGATNLTIDEIVDSAHRLGGIAIASHIDREAFGVIGQLGYIPEGLALDAAELSPNFGVREGVNIDSCDLPFVTFSDAHYLEAIGKKYTRFFLESFSFSEIVMALNGHGGRKVVI